MVTTIRHKLLNINVMLINFYNIKSYSGDTLHQFSKCCLAPIRYKKVCEKCDKQKFPNEILKGTDADNILTKQQQQKLKEQFDNQTIEILSFEKNNLDFKNLMPLIKSSKLILPSTSKGYKSRDIDIFLSFVNALKKLNAYCKVKYVARAKEHIGLLYIHQDDLVFVELPYATYYNTKDIIRIKESVDRIGIKPTMDSFAESYIKQHLVKDYDLNKEVEVREQLVKQYLQTATSEDEVITLQSVEEKNPFLIEEIAK